MGFTFENVDVSGTSMSRMGQNVLHVNTSSFSHENIKKAMFYLQFYKSYYNYFVWTFFSTPCDTNKIFYQF